MSTTETLRYNRVAQILHWVIGIAIIGNVAGGILHEPLEKIVPFIMPLHKSFGMTILALSVLRLLWRFTHKAPPLPVTMPGWEKTAAHTLVWIFYAMMILIPLSGWVMSSAGKWPIDWFGLFEFPKFAVTKDDPMAGIAHEAHEILGYLLIPLLMIHIGAALRHHFILKDDVLQRMTR